MTKILLVCDRKNWAYDAIARALVTHNPGDFEFEILYFKQEYSFLLDRSKQFDFIFFLGWQLILEPVKSFFPKKDVYKKRFNFIDDSRILTGIHSHHAWDRFKTLPNNKISPPQGLVDALRRFKGVNAVSKKLTDIFIQSGLTECFYTPNGMESEIFKPVVEIGKNNNFITVGFSGNRKHDFRKGIKEYIEPLRRFNWIRLKLAMPQSGYVPLEDMPQFYNDIDAYLCASSSEGFSLSVLEASACGRSVVSTRVGGCEDLIRDGYNGFFVKRDFNDIVEKLKRLHENRDILIEMGRNNRQEVEQKWSWKIRSQDWFRFMAGI